MVNKIKTLFLSDSYYEQLKEYNKIIDKKCECNWDIIVITASNEKQAKVYEKQINKRLSLGILPLDCEYIVIPDKDNKRIGSGGATLNVISILMNKFGNIDDKKIMLIHSGGDSKRIPQYSANGKLFSPVPKELRFGISSTLFDELMIIFCTVPLRMNKGMIIICGDALLLFNPLQLDLQYKDMVSITMRAPVIEGTEHGVIVDDKYGCVKKFLHKCSIEELYKENAVNNNFVNIDTGVIYFSSKVINLFYNLIKDYLEIFVNEDTRLNLYGDMLNPFAIDTTLDSFLNEKAEIEINNNIIKTRKLLWNLRKCLNYSMIKLSPSSFIHFGSNKEFYDLMVNNNEQYNVIGWKRDTNTTEYHDGSCLINTYIKNSTISNTFIENSRIINSVIGNNVIISNTDIKGLSIPDNIVLSTYKVEDGFVTRIYSIDENPKKNILYFLEKSVVDVNKKYDLKINTFQSIWDTELFVLAKNKSESLNNALSLYNIMNLKASDEEVINWKKSKKMSLKSSFNNFVYEDDSNLITDIIIQNIIESINNKENLQNIGENIKKSKYKKKVIKKLKKEAEIADFSQKIRLYYLLSIIDSQNEKIMINNVFESIKKLVLKNGFNNLLNRKFNKDNVDIYLPVRLNFAGGWTDTPPYCIENGGKVLNMSIKLNGKFPIHVRVEKIKKREIIIESRDLCEKTTLNNIDSIFNCNNPNDSFALVKAAIITSGLVNENDKSLNNLFDDINGGIKIITDVQDIPKGSGLGTSSILSSAILKALYSFMEINRSNEEICEDTLKLEQLMSTGGGWQDQVGGLEPGLKLIKSLPGINQKLNIRKINLSDDFIKEINNRIILINTGQRRLARNLLRDIVFKYISNDEKTISVLKKIQDYVDMQVECIKQEDLDLFGKLLGEHWNLIKEMDPGCSNLCIETIVKVIEDDICGCAIAGAGGGGFIIAILKKDVTKENISSKLEQIFNKTDVNLYDIEIV